MKITIIGCGYVGLVTAAGLAEFGHTVTGIDIDRHRIEMLNKGQIPIYEKGLSELIKRNVDAKRLSFSDNLRERAKDSEIIFITVGTPPCKDGAADLTQIEAVAQEIAEVIENYTIIVNKSTVPVGTAKLVREIITSNRKISVEFDVASNPEFLREGSAVQDFLNPDRVVIGVSSPEVETVMKLIYQPLVERGIPVICTNWETAELIKYASNAFLAVKISFINEMADLCEVTGADVEAIANGMGTDQRIGPAFLKAGPGYGGSCFPKDTKALIRVATNYGSDVKIVKAAVEVNEARFSKMAGKISDIIGGFKNKALAIWGLTFKADTDDLRESPAIPIINGLLASGAKLTVHDPLALKEARNIFGKRVKYGKDEYDTAANKDALVILTDWDIYRRINFERLKQIMKNPLLIDLRNIFNPKEIFQLGFKYVGLGRGMT